MKENIGTMIKPISEKANISSLKFSTIDTKEIIKGHKREIK